MCHLKYKLLICRHWSSKIKPCPLKCHKHGGIPLGPPKVKAHYYFCDKNVHCWMYIRFICDTGQINIAPWTFNEDAHPNVSDSEEDEQQVEVKDEKGVVKYDPKHAKRAKAAAVIAWLQECYPAYLNWLRWEEEELKERYHFDPDMYRSPDANNMAMTTVRYQDQQAAGANARYDDDAGYREKLREFKAWIEWYQKPPEEQQRLQLEQWQVEQAQAHAHAQQYAYQHQYPNHHQIQHHPDQYYPQSGYHPNHPQPTLLSSSSEHYLPAPDSTLYLTAPGDYDGHAGHAGVPGVPGVAGLLTAPPSAGKASGSKSSSSSRSKDASKHGKTEKKREPERDDKGRMGGKEKRRR